ncbi:MAG: hypothetical protein PUG74_12165 [Prevotellaceae bacterium]|nr:hypothetical protein [Prevotellaceae bacterium]
MNATIKGKEVIAYKRMNRHMRSLDYQCWDFQYEIGKTYKTDKAELYNCGFQACLNPIKVIDYPLISSSRFFKVKLSGEITKCSSDTELAATEITILEEIDIKEAIKTEWWKGENVLDFLYYSDGFARIGRGDMSYNFVDKQGKLLSDEWFRWVDIFRDGFAVVRREDYLNNYIDKQGKLLSKEWFIYVDYFNKDGFARVQRTNGGLYKNGGLCKIDKNGKIVSE